MSIFGKIFKNEDTKALKIYEERVAIINSLESNIQKLNDEELKGKTEEFKDRLKKGETLDDILPEAFAVVREATKRVLDQRHYDVQLIGGMVIHDHSIAEMKTGEGKTQVATLPAYLNALTEKGVHIVTVNDYLARRDAVWMGQIYSVLGLTASVINSQESYICDQSRQVENQEKDQDRDEEGSYKVVHEFLRPVTRKEAYEADITYGTNSEFGFDYLRDNIEYDENNLRHRGYHFAIIDEVDSILIDEARTPLIISAPTVGSENLYEVFAKISGKLKEEEDYTLDEKSKTIALKDSGIEKAEKALGVDNIYTEKGIKYVHHLETAVRAKAAYLNDKEYVVKDGEVVIIDQLTGRMQPSRRWSDGLHQAIEAKEGVRVQEESRTYASVTYQNFFRMYEKLAGMTGTAKTNEEEFFKVYRLKVIELPTNKPITRIDKNDMIFQTEIGKFKAIARKIKELNEKGQPVLVGTVSIEKNELLAEFLKKEGIKHEVLNAKRHESEGEIIAEAGRKGSVTIATNMAGRGVDIKLGGVPFDQEKYEEVKGIGGLYVIGTERHEARRIDNQLRGRSGRQGDPGETQFYVSLEDTLMRVFGSERIKGMMGKFGIPEDQPIQAGLVSKSLETAQNKIEGHMFDARKAVLEFDNVLNTQRKSIYEMRNEILLADAKKMDELLANLKEKDDKVEGIIEEKRGTMDPEEFSKIAKRIFLQSIDHLWVDHLENMSHVRSSVNLRAYGQRDPLIEYQKEGLRLFNELKEEVDHQIISLIPGIGEGAFKKEEERMKQTIKNAKLISSKNAGGDKKASQTAVREDKPGRNELVTIEKDGETQELKYKKAEPLLEEGWVLKK